MSVEQLEVLLVLHAEQNRAWSAAEINERLRSQEPSIAKWLEALVALKLVSLVEGRHRYAPGSEELAARVASLANAYRERRIKVIELIFSKPNETLLSFARAFQLRKQP